MFWVPWLMAAAFILTAIVVCYHLLNTIKGAGYVAFGNLA